MSDKSEIAITIQQSPNFDAGPDITSCSATVGIHIGDAPEIGCSYSWFPTTNLDNPNISDPELSLDQNIFMPESTEYHVTIAVGNCLFKDSLLVTSLPSPTVYDIEDTEVCESSFIELEAPTGESVLWQPIEVFSDPTDELQLLFPGNSIQVWYTVTNSWGCNKSDSTMITVNPLPDVMFEYVVTNSCPPSSVEVNNLSINESGFEYNWMLDGMPVNLDNNL